MLLVFYKEKVNGSCEMSIIFLRNQGQKNKRITMQQFGAKCDTT